MLEAYKLAFMAEVIPAAYKSCTAAGVPYQICCAQAALESGWGKKAAHYNYFGIKGQGDAGTQNWSTKEFLGTVEQGGGYGATKANFAKFSSPEVAFAAYSALVSSGTMFQGSTAYAYDPVVFVTYLWASGYASAPDYVQAIIGICQTFRRHLPELNQLSDKQLDAFGLTRQDADNAVACVPDFDLKVGKDVRAAVSILNAYTMGAARRAARNQLFQTDKIVSVKQNKTGLAITAAAIALAML